MAAPGTGTNYAYSPSQAWKHGLALMNRFMLFGLLLHVPILTAGASAASDALDSAIRDQVRTQQEGARSQTRIDTLADETEERLNDYRAALSETADLRAYNTQMERLVADQEAEQAALGQQLEEIEITKRRMVPLMVRMLEVLAQFVALDVPFLPQERQLRLDNLAQVMGRADVPLSEKYRRLLEAYRVEMQYGHTIEAYRGDVEADGQTRTVDILRLGRAGLYYLTFDGQQAGYWDGGAGVWSALPPESRRPVAHGIRMARKQMAPDLITLPVPAPEVAP